jgi:hypothetical protein
MNAVLPTMLGSLACHAVAAYDFRFPCIDKAGSLRSLRTLPHSQQRGYGNFEHFRSGAEAMKTVRQAQS